MQMLKKLILKYRCMYILRNRKYGNRLSFKKSRTMAILYNADDFSTLTTIQFLKKKLSEKQKKVSIFGILPNNPKKTTIPKAPENISLFGKIKYKKLYDFLNQSYDFLIVLNKSRDIEFKYIMLSSKSSCLVGFSSDPYSDKYQLSIINRKKDKTKKPINDLIHYLEIV